MIGVLMITQNQRVVNKGFSVNGVGINKFDVKKPLELELYVNNQKYCKVQSSLTNNYVQLNCAFNDVTIIESISTVYNTTQAIKTLINSTAEAMAGEGTKAFTKLMLPRMTYADGTPCGDMEIEQATDENGKKKPYTVLLANILGLNCKLYNVGNDKKVNATGGNYSYLYGEDNQVKAAIVEEFRKITIYAKEEIWFRIASLLAIRQLYEAAMDSENNNSHVYWLNKDIKQYANAAFVNSIISTTSPDCLPDNMGIVKEAKQKYYKNNFTIGGLIGGLFFTIFFLAVAFIMYSANNNLRNKCTEKTDGVVVKIERVEENTEDGTSISYAPVYEYTVNDKTYSHRSGNRTSKGLVKYKEGDKVVINYNPNNPDEYYVEGDNSNNIMVIIFASVGGIFLILSIVNVVRKLK